jgi:hypothetical protein
MCVECMCIQVLGAQPFHATLCDFLMEMSEHEGLMPVSCHATKSDAV